MAIEQASKSEGIAELTIEFTLNNLKDFNNFVSEEFFVRGKPWAIQIQKLSPPLVANASLGITLISKIVDPNNDWALFAIFAVKIFTCEIDKEPFERPINIPDLYSRAIPSRRIPSVMLWDKLIDSTNGYVKNDSCRLEVKVKAAQIQRTTNGDQLKFETIQSCDDCANRKFRMKIMDISRLVGVCSPEFVLHDYTCRITIHRVSDAMSVRLHGKKNSRLPASEYAATLTNKLISFDRNIEPITTKIENQTFQSNLYSAGYNRLVLWDKLKDPKNQFVQNGSVVIEFDLKLRPVEPVKSTPKRRREVNENDIECPICFESLRSSPASSLTCGHLFCLNCITKSLSKEQVCPSCKKKAKIGDLRTTYLTS